MPTSSSQVPRPAAPSRFYTPDGRLQGIVIRRPALPAPPAKKPVPPAVRELIDDGIIG